MAYKVRITNSAKAELDEIVAYFVNTLCKQNYIALYLIEDEENKKVVTIMHIFNAKRDYEKLV